MLQVGTFDNTMFAVFNFFLLQSKKSRGRCPKEESSAISKLIQQRTGCLPSRGVMTQSLQHECFHIFRKDAVQETILIPLE